MNAIRHDGGHPPFHKRALRILIVDDSLEYRESMALLLSGLGHEVATAFDGRVALSMAKKSPPDIVLLDISLPGMDGYELARRVRAVANRKKPLLVAVTGYTAPSDLVLSEEAGIELHLVKPVTFEDICDILARVQRTDQEKVL
jgi:CheY-like chemotaxis protein